MAIVHDYFFNRGVPESAITISSASEPVIYYDLSIANIIIIITLSINILCNKLGLVSRHLRHLFLSVFIIIHLSPIVNAFSENSHLDGFPYFLTVILQLALIPLLVVAVMVTLPAL
jgi:hypothetical protein